MRYENLPFSLRSFSARGLCQSSDALFHFTICSGLVQQVHTFSGETFTVASISTLALSISASLLRRFCTSPIVLLFFINSVRCLETLCEYQKLPNMGLPFQLSHPLPL